MENNNKTSPENELLAENPAMVHIELTEGSDRWPDIYFEHHPEEVINVLRPETNLFQFSCQNDIQLQVTVYSDRIIRFRYALKKEFPDDFSYAIDPQFQPKSTNIHFEAFADHFLIATDQIDCYIAKKDLKITIKDKEGFIISEEDKGFYARTTILEGIQHIAVSKKAQDKEAFLGLGDKSCSLNLRGQKLENWVTDAFAYGAKTDPLYRAIPFYYGLHQGKAYGIFFDNSYRTFFDFDSEETGEVTFSAKGGEINYYFIYGPDLNDIATQYTEITGRPDLPPKWAIGFHQCRWSYYPESRVREVANEFRNLNIPCDAIYLDIDYMDGYRCFTWNKDYFPAPTKMIRDLSDKGFRTIVMIDPGLKTDDNYQVYRDGKQKDYYCKRPDGEVMEGPVWPPNCAFPDFTKPVVRSWWGHQYAELYSKNRVAGFWNDMNEPAIFKINSKTFPENVRHDYDGHPCSHAKAHNIYGLTMSRATYEGLLHLKSHRRPFVITRATYAGGQRYASVWTGDNVASWEHLGIANTQCQRLSISGFSFVGSDIGGFVKTPSGELMVRWLQLGIFHPLYRVHSMGNNIDGAAEVESETVKEAEANNRLDQEPWSFGEEFTNYTRYAIELRYQLLPYLYTAFYEYVKTGKPMLRSLIFEDQNDPNLLGVEREFMSGEHLLVSPIIEEGVTQQKLYLPRGQWYHYWNAQSFTGGQTIEVEAPIHQIPIFVRAGAIIPHYPVMQYTDERPVDELMLQVYYKKGDCTSHLYEDTGDGFEHRDADVFSLKTLRTEGSENRMTIHQQKEGEHVDTYLHVNLLLNGLPFQPRICTVDGQDATIKTEEINGAMVYVVTCRNTFSEVIIEA